MSFELCRFTRIGAIALSAALVVVLLTCGATRSFAQGVYVALTPTTSTVTPGSDFEIDVSSTQAGSNFNAYHAVIGWDPAALTFVAVSPLSLQEGSYMTSACGNTFQDFQPSSSYVTVDHSLLCNNTSLPGPGQLYRLKFHASDTPQMTSLHLSGVQFYNAGLYVNPSNTQDATVNIGNVAAVDPTGNAGSMKLSLRPQINPARGRTAFEIESSLAGPQSLMVRDAQGRVVRHLQQGIFASGRRSVAWDSSDDAGARVSSGVYFVVLRAGTRSITAQVTLVR